MAGAQHLLRKAALEKMSSPEQLDMAMRVTSPLSWVALLTLGVLIAAAVVFSIVGRMSVKVDATGILLRGETLQTIQSTGNGVVASVEVAEGDLVTQGQLVARLELPDIDSEMRATQDRIADLELQGASRQAQLGSLRASYQRQLDELAARRANIEVLVRKQLKTRNDLAQIDAQISSVRAQMVQSSLGEVERENQLAEQRRKLTQLAEKKVASTEVRSPYRGRVAAVMRPRGQLIKQGERLINLEDPDAPFHVLLFVPFAEGKKVTPGMVVRISPTTVKPEEFGFILGKVESISSQAVTPEEVRNTLNNDQLAQKFAQETPFRVRAIPELDRKSASGFRWTSSVGPPHSIAANTPCAAQIIIEKRAPISYVIPTVKKALGL
jgi:HlyD family secretion protein